MIIIVMILAAILFLGLLMAGILGGKDSYIFGKPAYKDLGFWKLTSIPLIITIACVLAIVLIESNVYTVLSDKEQIISQILSIQKVENHYYITYDNDENKMLVLNADNNTIILAGDDSKATVEKTSTYKVYRMNDRVLKILLGQKKVNLLYDTYIINLPKASIEIMAESKIGLAILDKGE